MKKLYKFEVDFGRQGSLDGLFVSNESDFNMIIGKNVYFGEALGKHSDVEEVMTKEMFEVIELPDEVLDILEEKIGTTLSGFNPVDLLLEQEEE